VLDRYVVVRDQCLSARANFDTDMLHTRWTLLGMREDALQRGLSAPDEAYARHHCLHQGVETPDLATIKDFFAFISLRAVIITPLCKRVPSLALPDEHD
jgi:hypothetical protein